MNKRIVIDPEFQGWLPAISEDERRGLENSIVEEGCRDPLIVWPTDAGQIIVDGYNRYEICQQHGIYFETAKHQFESREAALNWMIDNQLGKRNITAEQRQYLIGKKYNQQKKPRGAPKKEIGNSCPIISTAQVIAEKESVAPRTVRNAGKYADAVDSLKETVGKDAAAAILSGKSNVHQKDVPALARAAEKKPDDVRQAIAGEKSVSRVLDKPQKPIEPPKPRPQEAGATITQMQARAALWDLCKRVVVSINGGSLNDAGKLFPAYKNQPGFRPDLLAAAIAITAYTFPVDAIAFMKATYNNLKEQSKGNGYGKESKSGLAAPVAGKYANRR